jgi:hypothetical protein
MIALFRRIKFSALDCLRDLISIHKVSV